MEDPLAWWQAAFSTASKYVSETHKQWEWSWIKSRSENRQRYIDLYLKQLNLREEDKEVEAFSYLDSVQV